MCGDGPDPVYQGKTYRRERVSLNEDTMSKYGNAWLAGSNNKLLKDSVQGASYYKENLDYNSPFNSGSSSRYLKLDGPPKPSRYTGIPMLGQRTAKTFKVNQHLAEGVYGADDGSFLMSSQVSRPGSNTIRLGSSNNSGPAQYETYRYTEDPNGQYGVSGFNDKFIPKSFMPLGGYDVKSTTGETKQVLSNIPDAPKQQSAQDNRKRQNNRVNTHSFRIELGTPSKKSGLSVPT